MKLRGEGKTGLRGPDPKDPNLTKSTQTIWRSKARSIESHQSAGNPSENDEASQAENSMRAEKEDWIQIHMKSWNESGPGPLSQEGPSAERLSTRIEGDLSVSPEVKPLNKEMVRETLGSPRR